MLGLLAEKGREKLNASSGDGAVRSEDLELGDGELDFPTLIGDVVEGVRERALEDVEDEGRAGDDGVVGDLCHEDDVSMMPSQRRQRLLTVQMCW